MHSICAALIACAGSAAGQLQTYDYKTTLDGGWTIAGTITVDTAAPVAFAEGVRQNPLFFGSDGVEYLDVTFTSPAGDDVFSAVNVDQGQVLYDWLTVTFDTTTGEFFQRIDIGEDTRTPGEYYLFGSINSDGFLIEVPNSPVDNRLDTTANLVIETTLIPSPAPVALIALATLAATRRRR